MEVSLTRPEVVALPQLLGKPELPVPAEYGGEDEEEGVEPDGGHHHQVPLLPRHRLAGPWSAQTQTSTVGRNCQEHYQVISRLY